VLGGVHVTHQLGDEEPGGAKVNSSSSIRAATNQTLAQIALARVAAAAVIAALSSEVTGQCSTHHQLKMKCLKEPR
jgi:hypothetical protein